MPIDIGITVSAAFLNGSTQIAVGASEPLSVTVKDTNGNALSGLTVALSGTGTGNTFTPASGTTNASGVFSSSFKSSAAQQVTITAKIGGSSPVVWSIDVLNTVQITTPGGDPYAPQDGSTGASNGAIQFPGLLALGSQSFALPNASFTRSYAARPPWLVAGVDYAVGPRTQFSSAYKDPFSSFTNGTTGTLVPALTAIGGVYAITANGTTPYAIGFSGSNANNAILQGYDFSLHGGIAVSVWNCTGFQVLDNNFVWSSQMVSNNSGPPIGLSGAEVGGGNNEAVNCSIMYNNINGQQLGVVGLGLITSTGVGNHTIQYNYLSNAYAEHIVYGQNDATNPAVNLSIRYNVMYDCLFGAAAGAHGDLIQVTQKFHAPTITNMTSMVWDWNLLIQDVAPNGQGTQGVSFQDGQNIPSFSVQNNTFVVPNSAVGMNDCFDADITDSSTGTVTFANNYMDSTATTGLRINYWSYTTSQITLTTSGNINMPTGHTITPVTGGVNSGYNNGAGNGPT